MAPADLLDEPMEKVVLPAQGSSSSSSSSWRDAPWRPGLEACERAPMSSEVSTNAPGSSSSSSSPSSSWGDGPAAWKRFPVDAEPASSWGDGPATWRKFPFDTEPTWTCAACTLINDVAVAACVLCETPRPAASPERCLPGRWQCEACTLHNNGGPECTACGAPRPCMLGSGAKQPCGYREDQENGVSMKGLQGAIIESYNPASVLQGGEPECLAKAPLFKVRSSQSLLQEDDKPDSTRFQPRDRAWSCGSQFAFPQELDMSPGQPWFSNGGYNPPGSFISSGSYHQAPSGPLGGGWGRADTAAVGFLEGIAQRWFSCCGRVGK